MKHAWSTAVAMSLVSIGAAGVLAADAAPLSAQAPVLSLAAAEQNKETVNTAPPAVAGVVGEQTTVTEKETCEAENWDIWGPVELRSADPEELGEIEVKNIYHYGTSSEGNGDTNTNLYEFELEYGIAPNNEVIFAVPVDLGDGAAEGNGNLELGWHWRLWKEQEWVPAFALRNILYIPSGYHASGLDWTFKGLITKSIIPDKWRVHLNPYFTVVSGDSPQPGAAAGVPAVALFQAPRGEDVRDFQWGFIVGTDYRLADNLNLILDYIHRTSEETGHRNQHSMEAGVEWTIDKYNHLGLATNWTVDGDSIDENWGFSVSYVLDFEVPAIGKK